MIDFSNLTKYKENNRIEAKRSLGGLPKSIWETYSAFANTLGGIILLGVEEYKDKSLHAVDLPDPGRLIEEFRSIANDKNKVSVNILSEKDISIENIDGNHIIVISVPRAQRCDKPVYIDGSLYTGSYRRNGEGDYRCSAGEINAMIRDAALMTQDMRMLEALSLDALDSETIRRYREKISACRPGSELQKLDDEAFLQKTGAAGRDRDGRLHPTAAGLLLLGRFEEIKNEYPEYKLSYCEKSPERNGGISFRIKSGDRGQSGNLFDFFLMVYERLVRSAEKHLPKTEKCDNNADRETRGKCIEAEKQLRLALREALVNCLVHADYSGKGGLSILSGRERITISNPGAFRIDVGEAKRFDVSDPRNTALIRMFSFADICTNTGNGIPNIRLVWKKLGLADPVIRESFNPDRVTLSLPMKKGRRPARIKASNPEEAAIAYLTDNISADIGTLAAYLGITAEKTGKLLDRMVDEGIAISNGVGSEAVYRLRA